MTKKQRARIEALRPVAEARYAEQNLLPRLEALIAEQNALVAERRANVYTYTFDWRPSDARLIAVNTEMDQVHRAIHSIQREVYGTW